MAGQRRGGTARRRVAALAVVMTLTVTGCIGTTSRADFNAELTQRSGGVPASLVHRALDALEQHLGVGSVRLRNIDIDERRQVLLVVRVPGTVDELDSYTYVDGDLRGPNAMSTSVRDTLETVTFSPSQVPALQDLSAVVARALTELDIPDARFDRLTVARSGDGARVTVHVDSDRRAGQVVFTADGEVEEVTLR